MDQEIILDNENGAPVSRFCSNDAQVYYSSYLHIGSGRHDGKKKRAADDAPRWWKTHSPDFGDAGKERHVRPCSLHVRS